MAEIGNNFNIQSEALAFSREACKMGLDVAAPYKEIIKWLLIGFISLLIVTNLVWGSVYWYQIKRAYDDPIEIDISQSQDFEGKTQEQTGKGAN